MVFIVINTFIYMFVVKTSQHMQKCALENLETELGIGLR